MRPRVARCMDLVPEIAPRLGIDAGGRFVEQQQRPARARCRRRAPAAVSSRPTVRPRVGRRARRGQAARSASCAAPSGVFEPIDARDELQILADGEIAIQREPLRHIADIALDLVLLRADVVAKTGALARSRASAGRRACGSSSSCRCRSGRETPGCARARRACVRLSTAFFWPKNLVRPSTSMAILSAGAFIAPRPPRARARSTRAIRAATRAPRLRAALPP